MANTAESLRSSLNTYLRSLSRKRSDNVVTADDAQNYLSKAGFRNNAMKRLSVINSVLREPLFENVGARPSSRPAAKSRQVSEWIAQ